MCGTCADFERRLAAGNVNASLGAIAQVVERLHGMEEAEGSSPSSSTYTRGEAPSLASRYLASWVEVACSIGSVLAGFVAGEGTFVSYRIRPDRNDGSARIRFRFQVSVASRDRPLLGALQTALGGVGSIQDYPATRPHWQPKSVYSVSSRHKIRTTVIPFIDRFLLSSAKRDQFDAWTAEFVAYEQAQPTRWGRGASTCSAPGCERPVRGRGLCRNHYYRATGY